MTAHELAAAARQAFAAFAERLALRADDVSEVLASQLHLVAWDREQLIGSVQARLAAMFSRTAARVRDGVPDAVRVVELRAQPLEAIEVVWAQLLAGRRVVFVAEPGACSAASALLGELVALLPAGALVPGDAPAREHVGFDATDPTTWPTLGVVPAAPRVAWVDEHADRELAAYVLARTCLRRSGTDPRGVHLAYVAGPTDRLQRHLQRLWVGAQLGPASDASSFAGPVDVSTRDAFLLAQAAWLAAPGVQAWCTGGLLEHSGDDGCYLAPAAFASDWPPPELPLVGPMCCIVRATPEQARPAIDAAAAQGAQIVQIGGRPLAHLPELRHIRGAVLVERLPPGLPEPRPV